MLAVGLIDLVLIGYEVGQSEAVMGDDEIDAARRPTLPGEQIGRTRQPGRDLTQPHRVAAPEAAGIVAETVVPFTPAARKRSNLIASSPDIPWLGDELKLAQYRVL